MSVFNIWWHDLFIFNLAHFLLNDSTTSNKLNRKLNESKEEVTEKLNPQPTPWNPENLIVGFRLGKTC